MQLFISKLYSFKIPKIDSSLFSKVRDMFFEEYVNFILWVPIFFLLGNLLGLYNYNSNFFSLRNLFISNGICLIILFNCQKKYHKLFLTIIFCFLLGLTYTKYYASKITTNFIKHDISNIIIQGQVQEILHVKNGLKVIISNIKVLNRDLELNNKIKIKLQGKSDFNVGDYIETKVNLSPPPYSLNPEKKFYRIVNFFEGIEAYGFNTGKVKIISFAQNFSFNNLIQNIRKNLAEKIYKTFGVEIGSIIAALIIGETSNIPEETAENMRNAGLSHILAVSGMHLSLIVGISFLIFRNTLVFIPNLAERADLKKISALIAIVFSFVYLFLSGANIAAKRAFIMCSVFVMGIIFDKQIDPKRSIALACFMVILITPQAVLKPSFQMSFAAALSLIAFYDLYIKYFSHLVVNRFAKYFAGICVTSLLAGLATMPYTIFHFSNYANFSIPANLLAIPLISFIIMPSLVLWLILQLLDLEIIIDKFIEISISILLQIAGFISSLPFSSLQLPSLSSLSLLVISIGFITLALFRTRLRLIGLFIILTGLFCNLFLQKPYLIILPKERAVVYNLSDKIYISSNVSKEYFIDNIINYYGNKEIKTLESEEGKLFEITKDYYYLFKVKNIYLIFDPIFFDYFEIHENFKYINFTNRVINLPNVIHAKQNNMPIYFN